jgi:hypothetical protein
MDVRITVETTFDNGEKRTHQLDGISRPYRVTCPDGIGLRLEGGKRCIDPAESAQFKPLMRMPQQGFSCPAPDGGGGSCRS